MRDLKASADIPGYPWPRVVTGTRKRPDIITVHQEKTVIILKLTCGFVTNEKGNVARKIGKYNPTIVDLQRKYKKVTSMNLSMSAQGLISKDKEGSGILQESKSIALSEQYSNSIVRQIVDICTRATNYIFCRKDKDWANPELFTF